MSPTELSIIIIIVILILCILMLLVQLHRAHESCATFKRTLKSHNVLRHNLINHIAPLEQLCYMIKNDHGNIFSKKSDKYLDGLIEGCGTAMIHINNIKD